MHLKNADAYNPNKIQNKKSGHWLVVSTALNFYVLMHTHTCTCINACVCLSVCLAHSCFFLLQSCLLLVLLRGLEFFTFSHILLASSLTLLLSHSLSLEMALSFYRAWIEPFECNALFSLIFEQLQLLHVFYLEFICTFSNYELYCPATGGNISNIG